MELWAAHSGSCNHFVSGDSAVKRHATFAAIAAIAFSVLGSGCGGGTDTSSNVGADAANAGADASGAGSDTSNASSGVVFCDSISGGSAKVSSVIDSTCIGCSVSDAAAAADGDLNSFASVNADSPMPGQGVSIRATAQPGAVFPAGQNATVSFVEMVNGTTVAVANTDVELRTYLGGQLQETSTDLQEYDCASCGPGSKPYTAQWFKTAKPFDAVEIFMNPPVSSSGATGPAFKVYEICSNSGN